MKKDRITHHNYNENSNGRENSNREFTVIYKNQQNEIVPQGDRAGNSGNTVRQILSEDDVESSTKARGYFY